MQTLSRASNTQVLVPLNPSETLKNHIHVAVRLKPMENLGPQGSQGKLAPRACPWVVVNDHSIRVNSKESFAFDSVFAQQSSTEEIFSKDLHDMLQNALRGYNATILAYG